MLFLVKLKKIQQKENLKRRGEIFQIQCLTRTNEKTRHTLNIKIRVITHIIGFMFK